MGKQSESRIELDHKKRSNWTGKQDGIVTVKRSKSRSRVIWRCFLGLMRGHFPAGFLGAVSSLSPIFLFLVGVGLSVITSPPTFLYLSVYVCVFGPISVKDILTSTVFLSANPNFFPHPTLWKSPQCRCYNNVIS